MSESIDDFFGDLKDYPGKRLPALRQQQPKGRSGPQELTDWDDHPRMLKLDGVDTEFFTVRHAALALNRSVRTIRTWERNNVIPPATFRTAKPRKSKLKETGDRLYTRAQIEAMIAAARDEGVLAGKAPTRAFTVKVMRAFLAQQEANPNRNT